MWSDVTVYAIFVVIIHWWYYCISFIRWAILFFIFNFNHFTHVNISITCYIILWNNLKHLPPPIQILRRVFCLHVMWCLLVYRNAERRHYNDPPTLIVTFELMSLQRKQKYIYNNQDYRTKVQNHYNYYFVRPSVCKKLYYIVLNIF